MARKIFRTTVGRFWGYVSIMIALGVSLAGNVTAAYLHDKDPSWVELGFAGIPPLVAFLSVEVVNHNPWEGTAWGRYVRGVLLGVVTPASAIVSFIHLTTVVITGREHGQTPEGVLNWITAVLTALLIDGLMIGGTAALLLPKVVQKVVEDSTVKSDDEPAAPLAAIEAYPDWRGEMERLIQAERAIQAESQQIFDTQSFIDQVVAAVAEARPAPRRAPVVKASLASQESQEERKRKRYPLGQHPLWADWVAARGTENEWKPQDYVDQMKHRLDEAVEPAAAQTALGRWRKAVEADPELLKLS